ncbi:ROK family transcriptional regulator [Nesterenkonia sp. HG001]|uniref:ROK family transcriptional regulator n=1 Tax=Nesterenkonia sp. HG001 TaxID=2983207 RepID=UPI002AC504D8|nr:ROK family transcriptional regulator [Nesterenkonia sp. HG001]MDZ5078583.1 ROK family transcriptional regulator [Nesterenkonia sp. HG001]
MQQLRRENARRVLEHMWGSGAATASELMELTGLTRATVLTLCKALVDEGWLTSAGTARRRGGHSTGRPALRYAFRPDAAYVIGVDAGQHGISAAVADLRANEVGRAHRRLDPEVLDPGFRRDEVDEAIDSALTAAAVEPERIRAIVLGVPAPVDLDGLSPGDANPFWRRMNPDLITLGDARGWPAIVENDANLAALAELRLSAEAPESSFAALLSGERFGAGIVMNGELVRQPRGRTGEMGFLDMVEGVGSSEGLGGLARRLARDALAQGRRDSSLAGVGADRVQAEHVFAAAHREDPLALEIVEDLAGRLARVCMLLGGLLDIDRVVLCGAVAPALGDLMEAVRRRLPENPYAPWLHVEASTLGADAVRAGAVRCAIDHVRAHALEV